MICARCLRSRALLPSSSLRTFSTTRPHLDPSTTASPRTTGTPAATSSIAQSFSTPLSPKPNAVSLGKELGKELHVEKEKKRVLPESICPAGTPLKGLNYFKGRDDPVALSEEEYPEWLWRCLDAKVKDEGVDSGAGDEFCMCFPSPVSWLSPSLF